MSIHTIIKIFSAAAVLCATQAAFAADGTKIGARSAAVAKEVEQALVQAQWTQRLKLATLRTVWERCDVLQSPTRANGKAKVRVVKPWTCKDVSTTCSAVLTDGYVYVPAFCFYAPSKGSQQVTLKDSRLFYADGKSVSLLQKFIGKVQDFAVFRN